MNDLGVGEQEEETEQPKIDTSKTELPTNVNPSPTSPARKNNSSVDENQSKSKSPEHTKTSPTKELKEPTVEHIYMAGSLGSTMSWGDQPIPELVYEIDDIHAIYYDRKRKYVMRRTTKKRNSPSIEHFS
jgi:hypothetical protein